MDAKRKRLQKKLDELMAQTTAVAVEMQALDQGVQTPHFDDIELPARALGRELSRRIQTQRVREVAAEQPARADCPTCGRACRVMTRKREVQSADGPLELMETVAPCRRCRRSFFPSAGSIGP
jgi:hypothetical protein